MTLTAEESKRTSATKVVLTAVSAGFSGLVAEIAASYDADKRTRHIGAGKLANRDTIIEVIGLLRELLFPGYFGRQGLSRDTIEYHIGKLLLEIRGRLVDQTFHTLLRQAPRQGDAEDLARGRAEIIVDDFLKEIPRLRALLATDVQAAFEGDPAATETDEIIFSYPGFFAITVYRIAHELYLRKVPLIPRIMSEYAHSLTGIDIHAGATIDESFFIDHGTGVVIGETAVIGKRAKIYQGVTLGAISTRGGQRLRGVKRHPTLDDEVTVYSGASILGGDTIIGKGAVIGGNAFVTQSVPPQTRVSVKNPELQYRGQQPMEFKQELPVDWVI